MNWLIPWQQRWQAASAREHRSVTLAAAVLGLAVVWSLALAPALKVWRTADAQHAALTAQHQQMLNLQAQARALQALPKVNAADARLALEASLKPLGTAAQLAQQPDRLTVTLKGLTAQALVQWLSATRQNAHLIPLEAHLKRADAAKDGWDGSVVFALPAQ
ncbi:MAG: type II secretion system protein GspM [Rhodoferax sp.]|nr:type II secretion system protein GspM [Rhodoferax sp.]